MKIINDPNNEPIITIPKDEGLISNGSCWSYLCKKCFEKEKPYLKKNPNVGWSEVCLNEEGINDGVCDVKGCNNKAFKEVYQHCKNFFKEINGKAFTKRVY